MRGGFFRNRTGVGSTPASAPDSQRQLPCRSCTEAEPRLAPPAQREQETVENPYDLKHLWHRATSRARHVIILVSEPGQLVHLVTKLFEASDELRSEVGA